jgi:3-methyladenine DNA glycosylase/8-oxoguanine DNA glycosylase
MRPADLPRAVRHLRRADPVLAGLVDQVGPCLYEVRRGGGPFAYLTAAIVHQQLAGAAAATIHRRLCALAGRQHPRPEDIGRLSDDELRGVGLSRQKIGYLRDLVARVGAGLPLGRLARLSDEAAIEALSSVKGIGRWTSEMFLMFRLGRLDVLPVDDLGIRKAMQRAFRKRALPKPDWMRKTAERWRPYRSVACWYLWRSLDG